MKVSQGHVFTVMAVTSLSIPESLEVMLGPCLPPSSGLYSNVCQTKGIHCLGKWTDSRCCLESMSAFVDIFPAPPASPHDLLWYCLAMLSWGHGLRLTYQLSARASFFPPGFEIPFYLALMESSF